MQTSDFLVIAISIVTFSFFAIIVLGSFAIAKMGESISMKRFWLGYIPVLQFYVIGKLIETIDFPNFRIPKAQFVLPLLPIIATLSVLYVSIPIVSVVLVFICAILWLYAWNTFFLLYCHPFKKAIAYTFIGGIFIIPIYLFVFLVRKNKPIQM